MKRFGEMIKYILYTLLLISVFFPLGAENEESFPFSVRGLWVIRHNLITPARIDSVMRLAEELKITDLFIQVRGRGDAYYRSRIEPRAPEISEGFDPLTYILQKNAQLDHRFRIHAWVNMLLVWSAPQPPADSNHVLVKHPDWAMVPKEHIRRPEVAVQLHNGKYREGIFLSPQIPAVRNYLLAVISDLLARYPVDGLHLDYIRYPFGKNDFNPVVRLNFSKRYIFDPELFLFNREEFVDNYGATGEEYYFLAWNKFLKEGLSELVALVSKRARSLNPEIILSAAVKPDLVEAHIRYGQAWDTWIEKGWLDWAIPMNYTPSTETYWNNITKMIKRVELNRCLMGIALYNQSGSEFIRKLEIIESLPLRGVVFFSYDQLKQNPSLRRIYNSYFK